MLTIRSILHPTDFSEASKAALDLAYALASDYNARLILAHVSVQAVTAAWEIAYPVTYEALEAGIHRELERLLPENATIVVERRLIFAPDPADEIVALAAQEGCDLIVMGTHGRSGLGRLVIGSVAEHVLRTAPCPVLTVRVPMPAHAESGEDTTSTRSKAAAGQAQSQEPSHVS